MGHLQPKAATRKESNAEKRARLRKKKREIERTKEEKEKLRVKREEAEREVSEAGIFKEIKLAKKEKMAAARRRGKR